jgi:hypothetical protein
MPPPLVRRPLALVILPQQCAPQQMKRQPKKMTEEQAKKRFFLLNFVRLIGLAMVLFGVANIAGKILPELSPLLGQGLLVMGAIEFFVVPVFIKKMWRNDAE